MNKDDSSSYILKFYDKVNNTCMFGIVHSTGMNNQSNGTLEVCL